MTAENHMLPSRPNSSAPVGPGANSVHHPGRRDARETPGAELGEPEVAVRARSDPAQALVGGGAPVARTPCTIARSGDPADPLPVDSVNQRFPSGPFAIPHGLLPGVIPVLYSVTSPAVVILPTRAPGLGEPHVPVRTAAILGDSR